eukprot:Gb_03573 [translate_table: standard]
MNRGTPYEKSTGVELQLLHDLNKGKKQVNNSWGRRSPLVATVVGQRCSIENSLGRPNKAEGMKIGIQSSSRLNHGGYELEMKAALVQNKRNGGPRRSIAETK